MMYASNAEFIKDFVNRTMHNYSLIEAKTPYEITLLINSSIGLLIIPKESEFTKITNDMIDDRLYKKLLNCIKQNTYINKLNLSQITRHIRNAIAHGRIDFEAEKQPRNDKPLIIKNVVFTDFNPENKKTKKPEENFNIVISIDLLREFMFEFARAASLSVVKKKE